MYSLQELTDISVRAAYSGDLQSMRVCLNEIYSGSGSSSSFRGMDERGGNGYVTPGDPSSLEPLIQTLEASLRGGNQELARENMINLFGMCDTFRGDLDSILETFRGIKNGILTEENFWKNLRDGTYKFKGCVNDNQGSAIKKISSIDNTELIKQLEIFSYKKQINDSLDKIILNDTLYYIDNNDDLYTMDLDSYHLGFYYQLLKKDTQSEKCIIDYVNERRAYSLVDQLKFYYDILPRFNIYQYENDIGNSLVKISIPTTYSPPPSPPTSSPPLSPQASPRSQTQINQVQKDYMQSFFSHLQRTQKGLSLKAKEVFGAAAVEKAANHTSSLRT